MGTSKDSAFKNMKKMKLPADRKTKNRYSLSQKTFDTSKTLKHAEPKNEVEDQTQNSLSVLQVLNRPKSPTFPSANPSPVPEEGKEDNGDPENTEELDLEDLRKVKPTALNTSETKTVGKG